MKKTKSTGENIDIAAGAKVVSSRMLIRMLLRHKQAEIVIARLEELGIDLPSEIHPAYLTELLDMMFDEHEFIDPVYDKWMDVEANERNVSEFLEWLVAFDPVTEDEACREDA